MSEPNMQDDELLAALGSNPFRPTIVELSKEAPKGPARVNFGSLKEKPKATGNSDYPALPDPQGSIALLAEEFLKQKDIEETAKGAKEVARGQLIEQAAPFHWQHNAGLAEIAGTISVKSNSGKEVLVQFKDAYKAITDIKDKAGNVVKSAEERMAALPPGVFETYFRQSFTLEIDSSKIPQDKLQAVVDQIQTLAQVLGIQEAVVVSACFKPLPTFHSDRYRALTPEQNQAIEKSFGEKGLMTIAVTAARGRRK